MKCQLQRQCKQIKKHDIASVNTGITSVRQSYFNTPVRSKQTSRSASSKRRGITLSRDLIKKIDNLYSDQDFNPKKAFIAKKLPRINPIRNVQQNYQIIREPVRPQPAKQVVRIQNTHLKRNIKTMPIQLEQKIFGTPKSTNRVQSICNSLQQMQSSFVTVKDLHSAKPSRRVSPASFSKNQFQSKFQLKQIKTSEYLQDSINEYYTK